MATLSSFTPNPQTFATPTPKYSYISGATPTSSIHPVYPSQSTPTVSAEMSRWGNGSDYTSAGTIDVNSATTMLPNNPALLAAQANSRVNANFNGGAGGDTSSFWGNLFGGSDNGGDTSSIWDNFGGKEGWGTPAVAGGVGLMNAYLGLQNLGVARDTLAAQQSQFAQNFGAQAKTTNAELSDRQNRRNADDAISGRTGSNLSTADYMAKYGI